MTIQEKVNADLKTAMLQKDEAKKSLLRVVIGEFNRVDKVVDDAKATSILKKMLENAKEQNNAAEIAIINEYLPKELSKEELSAAIEAIINVNNYTTMKDMGKVMTALKDQYAGQYDGKLASELIKSLLTK
jgi:uncharacterized protein YqeY